MTDISKAILAINSNAEFNVDADDIKQITWHNDTTPIAEADILAKQAELQADYEAKEQEKMKNMPMDAVLGSMLFFYRLGIDLSRVMTSYLEQEGDTIIHLRDSLQQSGVGIHRFTHSLKGILEELNISLN